MSLRGEDRASSTGEAERFLDHLAVERGLADNTLAAYRRDLRRYAAFLAARGVVRAQEVDEGAVRAFLASISASTHGDDERPYAASSVARALSTVRSFHRFCLREGLADHDPAAGVVRPRLPRALPHPLTQGEVGELLAAPPEGTPAGLRDRALLELLYGAGMRVSEATGLDVDDLDLDAAGVRVLGKGGKEREVPLGSFARVALAAYLTSGRPALASVRTRSAMFLNVRGGRLSRQSVARLVAGYARTAGIDRSVSPHDLRHSFATHLLDGGADVRVVQELLGHASVATTQIYTLVTAEHLRDIYDEAHPAREAPAYEGAMTVSEDRAEISGALQIQRDELRREIGDLGADPDRDEVSFEADAGFSDRSHSTEERARTIAVVRALRSNLRDVERALAKLDAGTYGACERCGRAIAPERLEAIPWALLCIDCKKLVGR